MSRFLPLSAALAITSGCVVAKDGVWEWDEGIEEVIIELGSGDVAVVPSDSPQTRLDLSLGGFSTTGVGPERDGHTLRIDLTCDGICGGDAQLEVPDHIDLRARVHRGDLHVEDLLVDHLELQVGAGDLSAVRIDAASAGVAVGAGSGDVEFVSVQCLWAEVGAGDAQVAVPAGTYNIDTQVGTGSLSRGRGILHDNDAEHCIHAAVNMGELRLEAR